MKTTNMMNKKNEIRVNHNDQTITVSKAFYKKASTYGSVEYMRLREAMRDNSGYQIVFKIIEKKTYKDLTFKRMEEYIQTQPDSEKKLAVFVAVQRVAKAKGSLYPLTKKWFLKTFPNYKENEVDEAETANLVAQMATEAEKEAAAEIEALITAA